MLTINSWRLQLQLS